MTSKDVKKTVGTMLGLSSGSFLTWWLVIRCAVPSADPYPFACTVAILAFAILGSILNIAIFYLFGVLE